MIDAARTLWVLVAGAAVALLAGALLFGGAAATEPTTLCVEIQDLDSGNSQRYKTTIVPGDAHVLDAEPGAYVGRGAAVSVAPITGIPWLDFAIWLLVGAILVQAGIWLGRRTR